MLFFSMILAAVVIARGIFVMTKNNFYRIIFSILVFGVSSKFLINKILTGKISLYPDVPDFLIFINLWLFGVVFILFFLLIIKDIALGITCLISFALKKYAPIKIHFYFKIATIVVTFLSVILATWGIFSAFSLPDVKEQEIKIANLPYSLNDTSIAVLTDLHADRLNNRERIEKIVEITNNLQADLVVITGDFADGAIDSVKDTLAPLKNLKSKYGVFGVPGNHEYYSGYQEYQSYLEQLGIKMLNNRFSPLAEEQIALIGVTDKAAAQYKFRENFPAPDIRSAMSGTENYPIKILLAHRPDMASEAKNYGLDLQISGHTHGGSILLFDLIVATFNDGFVSGLYKFKDSSMQLYVSNGSSIWSAFPFRIGVPNEITLIRLKR